jgi:8-oxo-dGTP diphosphatase
MVEYVLGLAFSKDQADVVLIRKNRPEWMKGKLNGVGGKLEESDQTPGHGMCREFFEETGVDIPTEGWSNCAVLTGTSAKIYIFRAFTDEIYKAASTTDEAVMILNVRDLLLGNYNRDFVPNIGWMIPLALRPGWGGDGFTLEVLPE